jgi:Site-specific recombinase XerD
MDFVHSYLEEISSNQTRRAYRTDLRRFFSQEEVEESLVQAVKPDGIQTFVRAMHREQESLSTQRRRLAALRGFFDWLITQGVCSYNPARTPKVEPLPPETSSSDASILTKAEVEELIATAGEPPRTGPRDQALIVTTVYAALRRSELAGLEADDIRPLGRYWVLNLQSTASGGGYVRIPQTVVEVIEQMKDRYGIAEGRLWRSLSNRNRGQPMSPDGLYKVVQRVSKRAGLDPVSIDTLRRTGLQLALQGGADLPQVQAQGRFSDSSSAARLHDATDHSGTLDDSAAEYIEIDVSEVLSDS